MPKFKYLAKTKGAKTVKEEVDAASKEELIARLKSRGLFVVSVKEAKEKNESGPYFSVFFHVKGKHASVKLYDLAFFARNLSITLSSGVILLRSLEILSSQSESVKLEKILKDCGKSIKEGLSLSETIAKYPNVFSSLWKSLVEVGETSGSLPFVLEKLADYLEMRINFERKIKSALVYPLILLIMAILAVLAFFKFILPKFVSLFKQFDVELPAPTRILFSLVEFLEKNFLITAAVFIAIAAGIYFFRKLPKTRNIWERIKMKLPIMGNLFFFSCLERLTSTVHILLDSGLPLIYTLEVAARSMGSSILEKSLLAVKDRVRDGAVLSDELSKLNIFPLLISEMAKIGEETGSMPQIFSKISAHYQRELATRVERLIVAFEPIMIILMGLVIGGIVVALFLPLFQLSSIGGKF